MAGCGGRRPNMEEEADGRSVEMPPVPAAQQGAENSNDPSAASHQENPENSQKIVFTEAQLGPLKAFFKRKLYPNNDEQEQLAKQLSVPKKRIQNWFKYGRYKMRMQKKFAHQGPESSDDPSAENPKENPEHSLENIQECPKTVFTIAQMSILEAFFKKNQCPSAEEQEELANQLSVSQDRIQRWFINRRRRERNLEKRARQRPESLDDHSAANFTEDPERLLRNIEEYEKSSFTEEQLNTLEALFETKRCLSRTELEQLADQLSLPKQIISTWFQNRIIKLKHQTLNSHPESKYQPHAESETPTEDQLNFLDKQSMDGTKNVAQAQTCSYLDNLPPPQPVDSSALPQRPHSLNTVVCQNVVGPPDSCAGREVSNILPESGEELPSDCLLNLSLPNQIIEPETSVLTPESSITTEVTSNDEPSTSSAPSTSQMTIAQDNFNLPETSVCTPGPSITTDLAFYNELCISPGPSTSQLPNPWYTAVQGNSIDTTSLIDDDETTDSD